MFAKQKHTLNAKLHNPLIDFEHDLHSFLFPTYWIAAAMSTNNFTSLSINSIENWEKKFFNDDEMLKFLYWNKVVRAETTISLEKQRNWINTEIRTKQRRVYDTSIPNTYIYQKFKAKFLLNHVSIEILIFFSLTSVDSSSFIMRNIVNNSQIKHL